MLLVPIAANKIKKSQMIKISKLKINILRRKILITAVILALLIGFFSGTLITQRLNQDQQTKTLSKFNEMIRLQAQIILRQKEMFDLSEAILNESAKSLNEGCFDLKQNKLDCLNNLVQFSHEVRSKQDNLEAEILQLTNEFQQKITEFDSRNNSIFKIDFLDQL